MAHKGGGYKFAKRQKELKKAQKLKAKMERKALKTAGPDGEESDDEESDDEESDDEELGESPEAITMSPAN